MKSILIKLHIFLKKIPLIVKSLLKIYRTGGYTCINITNTFYGEILKGKKILITGGGSGIGLSIARRCVEEGASVVITGRNAKKMEQAIEKIGSPSIKMLVWDVSAISQIDEKLKEAIMLLEGEIDILVNNAGVINGTAFPNVSEELWDYVYSTNSKGLFFITQALYTKWLENKKQNIKKIINISSQGAFVGATYPYRLSKWDVAGLTQGLGIKLASEGIIVNGIAPGIIATEMQPNCLAQKDNIFTGLNPSQRFALPDEVAELAIFLMSDSSNFIIGQTIVCDGGFSIK